MRPGRPLIPTMWCAIPSPAKTSASRAAVPIPTPPAEGGGRRGQKYYASPPLYPLARTLANINIDGINAWGPTAQIEHVPSGHSTLDEVLARHAQAQGRAVAPDSLPQNGSFYRAD